MMVEHTIVCPRCGEPLAAGTAICPVCHAAIPPNPPDPTTNPMLASRESPRTGEFTSPPAPSERPKSAFQVELTRRIARLQHWAEAAEALDIDLPSIPAWAEQAARNSSNPEPWGEVVRGVERLCQKRVVTALEEWERATKARLGRLEAYAVDSRLERDQIDDVLHSARTGDLSQALAMFQQVDRVVTLKERHLDQAREELERVVGLLRDMQALGVEPPEDPNEMAEELERELRTGRIAPLKQQIRALRSQAVNRLKTGLPPYISQYGNFLLRERGDGVAVEVEAEELARGAREFFKGHPEESLRRLRALAQVHGMGSFRGANRATDAPNRP